MREPHIYYIYDKQSTEGYFDGQDIYVNKYFDNDYIKIIIHEYIHYLLYKHNQLEDEDLTIELTNICYKVHQYLKIENLL